MNVQQQIQAYKKAFYKNDERGAVLYVPNLNEWFASCDIMRNGCDVTIKGTIPFFESDPFTVMTELPERLKEAIAAAGHPVLQIAIEPTENKIVYSYEKGDDLAAANFLFQLRFYVSEGIKKKLHAERGIIPWERK